MAANIAKLAEPLREGCRACTTADLMHLSLLFSANRHSAEKRRTQRRAIIVYIARTLQEVLHMGRRHV